MSYVSLEYLIFISIVFILYFSLPKKIQWIFLLICSYSFYLYGGIKPLFFILFTTVSTYFAGRFMGKYEKKCNDIIEEKKDSLDRSQRRTLKAEYASKKKVVLIAVLIANLGILFLLKYLNPIADNILSMFSFFSYDTSRPLINVILPLGISFYMFQSLSYCIDVFRAKYEPEKNIFKFALFISFFPQLAQGPISRYDQLGHQLYAAHKFNIDNFVRGAELIAWGFVKKIVIADRASMVVNEVFDNYTEFDGMQILIAMVIYTIQIYADFSGGIDITRGVAQIMGIDLVENFRRPYFADSVPEYWRRWHMSLTGWMRDYVFYPMTMSRKMLDLGNWSRKHIKGRTGKQLPAYVVTFTVFFFIGIWHGAAMGNLVFAFYNGFVIVLAMVMKPAFDKLSKGLKVNKEGKPFKLWSIVRTYLVMLIGKVIVRAISVKSAFAMLYISIFDFWHFDDIKGRLCDMGMGPSDWIALTIACLLFFTVSVLQENGVNIRDRIAEQKLPVRWLFYLVSIAFILIFGVYGPGYDATDFIYRNY